jgi:hypothetical protein
MNDTVLIALIAFISSSLTVLLTMLFKLCYASKCSSTSICCGCLEIKRDTEHEQSMRNLELGNMPKMPNMSNNNTEMIQL